MEEFSFTADEVRAQLSNLGYSNVSADKLRHFMIDLQNLIDSEKEAGSSAAQSFESHDSSAASFASNSNVSSEYGTRIPLAYQSRKSAFEKSKMTVYNDSGKENAHFRPDAFTAPTDHGELSPLHEKDKYNQSVTMPLESSISSINESQCKVRRKVARKRDGKTYVFDESSLDSSDASEITLLEERLESLPFHNRSRRHSDGNVTYSRNDPQGAQPLPAFIRPSSVKPHQRGIKKCDPVTRYHQFKNEWDYFKPPGEDSRSSLRWQIRGQLLNHEVFQRPHRQHAPNQYVVPTEKKRQSLRWQVRTNLAGT